MKLSEAELYAELGKEAGRGFGPPDLVRAGKDLFRSAWARVAEVICSSEEVKSLHRRTAGDNAEVAAAVADCIVGYLQGVSAATVAVLIVKRGLPKLCASHWSEAGQ